MIITALFVIKTVVSILFVLILSLLAEHVSPKVSGIISGVPTGTAIILFFYGLEQGEIFASESSLFNLVGMVSMQAFIYIYFRVSKNNSLTNILFSSIAATIVYLIIIFFLRQFQLNIAAASAISIISILLFTFLFKKIGDSTIKRRVNLGA